MAVLAALFGAALPYLELAIGGVSPSKRFERGKVRVAEDQSLFIDAAAAMWSSDVPLTDAEWDIVHDTCHGLLPEDALAATRWEPHAYVGVFRIGWPFRAAHMCFFSDHEAQKHQSSSNTLKRGYLSNAWLNRKLPVDLPKGVVVWGVIGNILVSIVLFGGLYCGKSYWRAKRRIKRGKCWKCGYLSNGAAVCPECGVGVKA